MYVIQNHSHAVIRGIIWAHGFQRNKAAIEHFNQLLLNYSSDHIDIPDILQQRGILYEKDGEYALALHDFSQALDIRRARVRANLEGIATLHNQIGQVYTASSEFQASLDSYKEAMNVYDQLYPQDDNHVAIATTNEYIGLTHLRAGNMSEALQHLNYAQTTYKRLLHDRHFLLVQILGHLGTVYESRDDLLSAMKLFHRQLNRSEEILPADHPFIITSLNALLRLEIRTSHTLNISIRLNDYLQKLSKTLGDRRSSLVNISNMLSSVVETIEPSAAIELYERFLEIAEMLKESNRSLLSYSHRKLAKLQVKIGNLTIALHHVVKALQIQQQFSLAGENRLAEANDVRTIALLYLEMKSPINALQYLTKSLSIYQAVRRLDHPDVQTVLADIGRAVKQSKSHQ